MSTESRADTDGAPPFEEEVLDRKYRLVRRLGQGGMGSVWLARHLGTDRPVAVKLIRSGLLMNQEVVRRFAREARTLGRLRHPNIVNIIDYGTTDRDGTASSYLVMEYLEGSTLRGFLDQEGALLLSTVVDLTEQIGAAVSAAHKIGIVHRDLKPDNVWLIPNARGGIDVKVLDFGIAKVLEQSMQTASKTVEIDLPARADPESTLIQESADTTETIVPSTEATAPDSAHSGSSTTFVTRFGTTIGTPTYMSPEQCRGEPVEPASDVYSMAVIAYECLSGRRPFSGTFTELLRKHVNDPPPRLDGVTPGISSRIADTVDRSLAKRPGDRHPSPEVFAAALRFASHTPWILFRRAVALYAERYDELVWLAVRAAAPLVPALLLLLLLGSSRFLMDTEPFEGLRWIEHGLFGFESRQIELLVLLFATALVSLISFGAVTAAIRTSFVYAFQEIRSRPLASIDAHEILARVARRFGYPRYGIRAAVGAAFLLARHGSSPSALRTPSDLSHVVSVLEELDHDTAVRRARSLLAGSRQNWEVVALGTTSSVILAMLFAGLLNMMGTAIELPVQGHIGLWAGLVLLPMVVPFAEPVSALSILLFYGSARSAHGEQTQ